MQLRIDIRKMSNVELITEFVTDMMPDDIVYYTDNNGIQVSFYASNLSIIFQKSFKVNFNS